MANYTKREQNRAEIAAMLEIGLKPRPEPRLCHCGEVAIVGVYTRRGNFYFCEAHRAEADAVFERGGAPDRKL